MYNILCFQEPEEPLLDFHVPNDQRFSDDEQRVEDKFDDAINLRKDVDKLAERMDNTQNVCESLSRQLAELQMYKGHCLFMFTHFIYLARFVMVRISLQGVEVPTRHSICLLGIFQMMLMKRLSNRHWVWKPNVY